MSLFGEDDFDRRDFRMGLAGLLAGIHSLRILAERGVASPEDISVSREGIDKLLTMIPDGQIPPAQLAGLGDLLDKVYAAAVLNFNGTAT